MTEEDEDDLPSWWVFITTFLVWLIVSAVLRAYVIAKLWGWFVVPAFSLPEISMSTAFGLSLLVSLFTTAPTQDAKGKGWSDLVGMMGGALIGYVITLAVGGAVHAFVS